MPDLFNPFPGLRPFDIEEDYLFFGREQQTAELLKLLRDKRFLSVIGTSGSGKSSLVRAGLLPELQGGALNEAGSNWEIVVLRPGGDPLHNLAAAVQAADLYDPDDPKVLSHLKATLTHSGLGLVEAIKQSDVEPGANLLIVVDQFEEIFRFRRMDEDSAAMAASFVDLLLEATKQSDQPIYVVLTMRSDYLGDCTQFRGLTTAVNQGEYLIPRLTRDQIRTAIEGPVRVGGGEISYRLVQELLNSVGSNQDQLPILQHALMRTFDRWTSDREDDEPIDLRHYHDVGGMEEALSRHADEVFDSLESEDLKGVAENLFKALTEKQSDNRGIRRPTPVGLLGQIVGVEFDQIQRVVDAYRAPGVTFLMPPAGTELVSETIVDISHESLMRVWQRLDRWVGDEAQSAQVYLRLAETAGLHRDDKAGLYRGPDLQIALAWMNEAQPTAAWGERYRRGFHLALEFLEASDAAGRADEIAAEEQRQRELEQARALADAERQRAELQQKSVSRLRLLSGGVAAVALVAVFASVFAFQARTKAVVAGKQAVEERRKAVKNAEEAQVAEGKARKSAQEAAVQQGKAEASQEVAETARDSLNETLTRSYFLTAKQFLDTGDLDNGLAYLARTIRTDPTYWPAANQITSVLADANYYRGSPFKIEMDDPIDRASLDPATKSYYWTLTRGRQAALWDVKNRRKIGAIAGGARVNNLRFSDDGSLLFAKLLDQGGSIQGYRTRDGKAATGIVKFENRSNSNYFVVEPRDGVRRIVAYNTGVGAYSLWDADTAKIVGQPLKPDPQLPLYHIGISANKKYVVCTYRDGTVILWSAETAKLVFQAKLPGGGPVYFPRTRGPYVAVVMDSGTRFGWIDTSRKPLKLLSFEVDYPAKDFGFHSHSPQMYATGVKGEDMYTTVVDLSTAKATCKFKLEGYAADGRSPFIGRPRINRRISGVGSAEPWMATYVGSSVVDCRDLWTGKSISKLDFSGNVLHEAIVTQDGLRLITQHEDLSVHIWDLMTGEAMISPIRHSLDPTLSLTADGERLLITTADDRKIHVWSTRTGQRLQEGRRFSTGPAESFSSLTNRSMVLTRFKSLFGNGGQLKVGESRAWKMASGRRLYSTVELIGFGASITFSPDDKWIVPQFRHGPDPASQVLDVETLKEVRAFRSPTNALYSRFSPDGKTLGVACRDGQIRIWDVASGELRVTMMAGESVHWIEFAMQGKLVAARTFAGKIIVFDVKSGYALHRFDDLRATQSDVAESSPWLAVGNRAGDSFLVNMESGDVEKLSPSSDAPVQQIQLNADGTRVLSVVFTSQPRVWDTNSRELLFETPEAGFYSSGVFHPSGRVVALTASPHNDLKWGKVELWDIDKKTQISEPLESGGQTNQGRINFSHNGRMLAVGNARGGLSVWEYPTGTRLLKISLGVVTRSRVNSLEFSHDDTRLAVYGFTPSTRSGRLTMIDLPPSGHDAPEWLADLAEVVAKRRINRNGDSVAVAPSQMASVRASVEATPTGDSYARWGRWFMADPDTRASSPWSHRSRREQLDVLLRSRNLNELHRVLEFDPNSGLAHARIAYWRSVSKRIEKLQPHAVRHWLETAGWHADQAVELAPDLAEAWALRALVMRRGERFDEMDKAVRKGLELDANHVVVQYANALALEHHGKHEESFGAFRRAFQELPEPRLDADWPVGRPVLPGILDALMWQDHGTPHGLAAAGERRMTETSSPLETRTLEWEWLTRLAIELHPKDPVVWQSRANALMLAGRKDEASEALTHLGATTSDGPVDPRQLGSVIRAAADRLAEQGRFDQAHKLFLELGIPKRSSRATSRHVSLDKHYNQSLFAMPFRPREGKLPKGRVWQRLPIGLSDFNGMPFDVRGVVRVRGGDKPAKSIGAPPPTKIEKIAVNQKANWLHVLHGCSYVEKASYNTLLGRYLLHYEDGTEKSLPIRYGKHLVTWVNNPFATPTDAVFGWREGDYEQTRTLVHCTWENPHPDKAIASITLESAKNNGSVFLVAMTLEVAESPDKKRDARSLLAEARLKSNMVNGASDVTFGHVEALLAQATAAARGRDDLAVPLAHSRAELLLARGKHKEAIAAIDGLSSGDRKTEFALRTLRGRALYQGGDTDGAVRHLGMAAGVASHVAGRAVGLDHQLTQRLFFQNIMKNGKRESRRFVLRSQVPPRAKDAPESTVDLTPHFNAGIHESWLTEDGAATVQAPLYRTLDAGVRRFRGIPFDVRGVVSLSAGMKSEIPFPPSVPKITVGRKADRLHFLHGGYLRAASGSPVAVYRIVYADGHVEDFAARFQLTIGDAFVGSKDPDSPFLVWRGEGTGLQQGRRDTGLFLATWDNPRPDQKIVHIDFIATLNRVNPFLVALTVSRDADSLSDESLSPIDLASQAVYFAGRSVGDEKLAGHAGALMKRAIQRAPKNAGVWRMQAEAYRILGELDEASRSIEQALELDADSGEVLKTREKIQVAQRKLAGARLSRIAARKKTLSDLLTARDTTLTANQLDLTSHYNVALSEDLYKLPKREPETNDGLHGLVAGPTKLHGVVFDVRGFVALHGKKTQLLASRAQIVEKVTGIAVGRTAQTIHFLHGAAYSDQVAYGTVVGRYRIHYADGSEQVVNIRYGEHLLNWFLPQNRQVAAARLAFSITSQRDADRELGCYLMSWKNPKRDVKVTHIDFETSGSDAAPFLLGVTLDTAEISKASSQ